MSEAARALIRMATNYARLAVTLALGVIYIRFLFRWLGEDAAGVVLFLGAGVGIPGLLREITSRACVREIAAAYHSKDPAAFREAMASATIVSLFAAVALAGVAAVLFALVGSLQIPDHLDGAARFLVVTQGVYLIVSCALSPVFNLIVVTEKFFVSNLLLVLDRACYLGTALALSAFRPTDDPAQALREFGFVVALGQITVFLVAVAAILALRPAARPRLRSATRARVRSVMSTVGWYFTTELAANLYERVSPFIMNMMFGLAASTVYNVAYQFVSYVRQVAQGVTSGLDAVSARIGTSAGRDTLRVLIHHATRVHALVALPAGLACAVLADPLVRLWLESDNKFLKDGIPSVVTTVQIMCVALTARSISDCWVMVLYGAGYIRKYAPFVLAGGLLHPFVSLAAISLLKPNHPTAAFYATAVTFSSLFTVVHFLIIPKVASACLSMRYSEIFSPMSRSLVAAILTSPILLFADAALRSLGLAWGFTTVAAVGLLFSLCFGIAAIAIVLTGDERRRFILSPLKRLTQRGG